MFEGRIYREREETFYGPDLTPKTGRLRKHTRRVLEPIDLQLHINPASIGLGLLGLGAGLFGLGLAGWWAGLGLEVRSDIDQADLEQQLAAKRQGLANLEEDLADREANNQCISEEIVGGIFLRFDACADLRAIIKDFKAEIMKLEMRLKVPVRLVTRDRFQGIGSLL